MNANVEYEEVKETTEVPKHSGVEGFLLVIRNILRLPRVVNITIDSRGVVSFTRFARREEQRVSMIVDFDVVAPSAIIRNGHVIEVDASPFHGNAAVTLAALFTRAARDHMYPLAWVTGAATHLPGWHQASTGVELPEASAFGLQIYRDRFIPDEALLLACGYSPNGGLVDAQMAYKVTMPAPNTQPQILEDEPAKSSPQETP